MLKYIIFDFDGTLVDSKKTVISVFNQLADKYNYRKVQDEEVENLRRLTMLERSKVLNFPLYRLPYIALELYQLYREGIKSVFLFDGIKDLLDALVEQGYQLAIISSNAESTIRQFLQKNQIYAVKEICCSSNLFGKDRIIRNFLKKNRLSSAEVIYVGDEVRDVVACKQNGVKIIWVGWGYDVMEMVQTEEPDHMVVSPMDILRVLQYQKTSRDLP
jgi:phosphoglycolate phosphatase